MSRREGNETTHNQKRRGRKKGRKFLSLPENSKDYHVVSSEREIYSLFNWSILCFPRFTPELHSIVYMLMFLTRCTCYNKEAPFKLKFIFFLAKISNSSNSSSSSNNNNRAYILYLCGQLHEFLFSNQLC